MKVSVVIPCYNDGKTIIHPINAAKNNRHVSQIIVINDGSDKKTTDILNRISGINLINLSINKGKANAMWLGLTASKEDIVLFLDADYVGITPQQITAITQPIIEGNYDSVIGDIQGEMAFFRSIGIVTALSGARAFKRKIIIKYPEIFRSNDGIKGYLIETKINQIFFKGYKVAKTPLFGIDNEYKLTKFGLPGFIKDIKVQYEIFKFAGLKEVLFQWKVARNLENIN